MPSYDEKDPLKSFDADKFIEGIPEGFKGAAMNEIGSLQALLSGQSPEEAVHVLREKLRDTLVSLDSLGDLKGKKT